jgi:hypothetical protein
MGALQMNANELAEDLEGAKLVIVRLNDMLRQQQAEMDLVIKLLCGEQISDDLMAYWNPLHSTLKSKLLKAQEK